ncbi:MAG: heme biosynthesis HemY N-terminal domain-containing protein [Methylococcales bacterium]|nr:heme biosynthesis HemY N-terminal domain-containing protein [Methylococcales bacterium]
MKKMLFLLIILGGLGAGGFYGSQFLTRLNSAGYVLIGIEQWSLETSLFVFLGVLVALFFALYFSFRLLGWSFRLPKQIKKRVASNRLAISQKALIKGLVDSAEGNWEEAEDILIKHASHSGTPLIHYLTAARAAQSRGAFDKRDEYLQFAAEHGNDAEIAVGLTQAELNLSGQQYTEALETLTRLHSINPTQASVLRLLHKTYQHLGDWQALRSLIPSLNTHKVLMEAELKLVETEMFSNLLKQAAEQKDRNTLQTLWVEMPLSIKVMRGVAAIYFAAMIDVGAGANIEDELVKNLSANWSETLLVFFGNIQSTDPVLQLETAERWLIGHANDAILLMVLGKLSSQRADYAKAQRYLNQSITLEPNVQSYRLLGDLAMMQGDANTASQFYKQGLELASSELVNRIETLAI